jgi:hypothetical protein
MANDKTLLYVGIAGAAGFGLYYYLRNEYHYKLVTMTMPTMSQPSFWEILLGSAQAELAKARMLDDAMKMRGEAHYKAWKAAVNAGKALYMFESKCYETATGMFKVCP